jgi:hypothetical protein
MIEYMTTHGCSIDMHLKSSAYRKRWTEQNLAVKVYVSTSDIRRLVQPAMNPPSAGHGHIIKLGEVRGISNKWPRLDQLSKQPEGSEGSERYADSSGRWVCWCLAIECNWDHYLMHYHLQILSIAVKLWGKPFCSWGREWLYVTDVTVARKTIWGDHCSPIQTTTIFDPVWWNILVEETSCSKLPIGIIPPDHDTMCHICTNSLHNVRLNSTAVCAHLVENLKIRFPTK